MASREFDVYCAHTSLASALFVRIGRYSVAIDWSLSFLLSCVLSRLDPIEVMRIDCVV